MRSGGADFCDAILRMISEDRTAYIDVLLLKELAISVRDLLDCTNYETLFAGVFTRAQPICRSGNSQIVPCAPSRELKSENGLQMLNRAVLASAHRAICSPRLVSR